MRETAAGILIANSIADVEKFLVGGTNPAGAASRTGDISQIVKWIADTTPPTGNKDASIREQVEAIVVQLLESGTANALTGSASGSLGQQIAMAASLRVASGGGRYLIPAGPSIGTAVASAASANAYGSWVTMSAGEAAAVYLVGVSVAMTTQNAQTYIQVDIGTGATPTSVGEFFLSVLRDAAGVAMVNSAFLPIDPWIKVAGSTAIKARTADNSATAYNNEITLHCILASEVVAG